MIQIDKEVEIHKTKEKKSKASIEWKNIIPIEEEKQESSYSSMSMYNLDSDK